MSPGDSFPLFDLPPANLEKVLRKLQSKSFRRLQQTSWQTWDFIQKNSKVSVFTDGKFFLKARREPDSSYSLYIGYKKRNDFKEINPEGLYGSRLASLDISGFNSPLFQPVCDFVQKYRLSCGELLLQYMEWQKEEYEALLTVLKPVSVEQLKCRFNAFEALYSSSILKNVTAAVDFDSAPEATAIFLSTCQRVKITVPNKTDNQRETSAQLCLFHRILQIFLSEPRTRLLQFVFVLETPMPELPTEGALRIELTDFSLTNVYGDKKLLYTNVVLPPEHYSEKCHLGVALRSGRPKWPAGDINYSKH